jgi:hypothetical protein
MLKENSQNMLEKYFLPKRITQIIGDSLSMKESFIPVYLANKAVETSSKIILIYSKNTLNLRYFYEFHKILEKTGKYPFSEDEFEKKYLFFEFIKYDSMGDFIFNHLPKILEREKTVSTIVLNNLNNYFSTKSFKFQQDHRKLGKHLLDISKKYNLNIIYLNDYFYYLETKFLKNRNNINYVDPNNQNVNNINKDNNKLEENRENNSENEEEEEENNEIEDYYNKEPINFDILGEFCSHILFFESRKPRAYYGNFGNEDLIEQSEIKILKSNYKPHKKYLVTLNKKFFSYNIEIS